MSNPKHIPQDNQHFNVNIYHPSYQSYKGQHERYGFGESVDLDIRCIFHLMPDLIRGYEISEAEKTDLLSDLFIYLDEFFVLHFDPNKGQFNIEKAAMLEPDSRKRISPVLEHDCLYNTPCKHPLYINTYHPAFVEYSNLYLKPYGNDNTQLNNVPETILPLLPDKVMGNRIDELSKRKLLSGLPIHLGNKIQLHLDKASYLFYVTDIDKTGVNKTNATTILKRSSCSYDYEKIMSQIVLPGGEDIEQKPNSFLKKNGNSLNL